MKPLVSLRYLETLMGRDRNDIRRIASHTGRYYKPFDVKRRGTTNWRHIDNPTHEIKFYQKKIQKSILYQHHFPEDFFGSLPNKSIIGSASFHVGRDVLVTLDMKSYFMRIDDKSVFDAFVKVYKCSTEIASLLTKLTTFQGRLPQGAPTSPALANAVSLSMFQKIREVCNNSNVRFSCYVDDIAISGQKALAVTEDIIQIIHSYGHSVTRKKIRVMPQNTQQKVTGLVTNKKVSVCNEYIKTLMRQILELSNQPTMYNYQNNSIIGKINFIKQVHLEKAIVIDNFAKKHLPMVIIDGIRPVEVETRPCKNVRKHTYYQPREVK